MATKKQSVNQNFTMEDFLRAGYRVRPAPESTEVATPEPEPSRGALRAVADVGLEAASGAAKGIKFMSDVFGASNPVSQGLQGVSDFAKELQSAQAKGEDQRIAQLMKEAEDKGVGEQVKAALRAAGEAPVRQAIGAIGTSVPMIAASMVPGLREASWGTRAAALGGMGGAQGVGVVKSQMYDSVYQRALEEGRSEQEARALADQAQAYSPENASDIALGGALGAGAALTGFEPAAARAIGRTAANGMQRGLMQSTLRGVAAEALPEAIQGGQEQVAGNRAQQRTGFDTPTFRGAIGSATLEGLLSAPGGAAGGMLDARGAKPAPKLLADQIRATESVPESGPMTRAANQAVEARAQQVELSAAAEGAALAEMEAQSQADLQGLRDFAGVTPNVVASMPMADQPPVAAPSAQPSAEFIDSPFTDRILTVQEMLADPATREKVRERWGDEGLGNIAYYLGVANRGGMPEKTQENLLGMAERLLQEAVLQPIQPAPELGGQRPDPLLLGQASAAVTPAIGMDATPSGRFTVDPQGNVAPESRVQAMDAQRRAEEAALLGEQTPRGQQTEQAPTALAPMAIGMDAAPTGRMLAGQEGVRPEIRMDAINIAQADMQRQAEAAQRAELGLTPDIEAVQQRNAMRPQDGDILNPVGEPFKTRMAVQRSAKKNPGEIVEVTGGFVIRPAATMSTQQEVTGDERGNQAATAAAQGPADGVPAAADREMSAAEAGQGGVLDAVSGQPGATEPAQGDAQGAGEQPVTPLTAQPNVEVPAEAAPTPGAERGVPVAGAAGEPVEAAGVAQQAADTVSAVAGVERFDGAPAAEPTQQVDNQPAAEAAQPQPAAVTITADDVAAAEKQAAQQIADRIDGMKAQEAQKIAARYLPTIGVKVPIGKARIKAAMTDAAGVNLLGPAGELGIELSDSVKQALTAKREGRIGMLTAEPVATALPAAQATHQDPGASPEAVNKTVVNASMAKAARNEDAKPSEMRQWLLERIDQELQKAPDRPDYDALVKSMSEKDAIGMFTGSGPFGRTGETGYVSFDVPGDGTFKVRNSVRGLLEFRKRVEASPGFRDRGQQRARNEENQGVQRGSGGLVNAFNNMVEEGDLEAASDYADAVGLGLDAKKMAGATKVLKWRESRDAAAEKASIDAAMNQSEVGQLAPARPDAGRRADGPQADVGQANANQPEPTPTPKAEAARPADDKPRLTDAGEELTRNRRNRVTGITWVDVEGMNDTLKVKTVTKANVWQKPNYEKLVEDGAPRWKVAILKAIYDKLAAKPDASRALTDDQMKRYIETLGKVRDAVMAELDRVESSAAVKAAFESDEVKSFAAKGDDMVQAAAIMGLRGVLDGNRIMDAVFPKPEGAKLGRFDRTTEQGKDNNTNALLIGGNNALQAMQFNYKAVSKARDLLMEGFPAKQEAWSKSYNITPKDGHFFVIKKGYTFRRADNHPAEGFETQEQAQDFAREITKRGADKPLPPSRGLDLADAKRTGPDWRAGKDVTSDEVKDAFGFRGVNLGEYVKANQKIAQLHLNNAYDGLMDLADLMGVPPKAISLNGTLGLAIGAQGSGRALAHFVPGVNEINITRDSGAGALAHEWAHALDHYFGVQDSERIAKSQEPFLTEHLGGKPDGVRPEVFEAFKAMVEAMKRKTMTQDEAREWLKGERIKAERALKFTIENMKAADQAAFDELGAKLMAGDVGNAGPDGVPGNIAGFLAAAKGDITQKARLTMAAERVNALRDEVRFFNTHRPQARTNYAKASGALDAGKTKAYWSTNLEMFARAFESYVMDALADRQRESLYLSGLSESPSWQEWEKKTGQLSPFPKAEERLAINQAAQALVNAIETRETDKGVAMFSRRSASGNRLPDAIIGHKLGDLNNHPDYAAAKAGDALAAARVAVDLVDDAFVRRVLDAAGDADIIVPVVSIEASGRNKIPAAVADLLAEKFGSEATSDIVQANSPKRTAMDGLDRLLNPPVFDGPVQAGAAYVLVDDTLTQGGTFAALASHINDGGGKVVAAVALTGKQYSAKLAPSQELLKQVRERYQSVEDQFRAATGYGFDALTESEARYLAKHDNAQLVRDRIAAAGNQTGNAPNASLSRPIASQNGLTKQAASAVVDSITARWDNAPEVVVAADMRDTAIPQAVRDYDAEQRSLGAQGEPEGFWYGGKAYIVASAVRSPSDVMRVLFHEALGHYGLRGVFGSSFKPILQQIAAMRRAEVQAKADEYGLDMNDEAQRLQAAEEVLAVMAQTRPELGYVKRAIAAVRSWLRKAAPKLFSQMKLTDAEIIRDYILPARRFVERGGPNGGPGGGISLSRSAGDQATPSFSRNRLSDAIDSMRAFDVKGATGDRLKHWRGMALQFLGRRQMVDLYGDEMPALKTYSRLVESMDADKNDATAQADELARAWSKLDKATEKPGEERRLAELMHDATLAQIDPSKDYVTGDNRAQWAALKNRFVKLDPQAQALFTQVRDAYTAHYNRVKQAVLERIERSNIDGGRKRAMMARIEDEFLSKLKGVYFPLARFGRYVVVVRDGAGEVASVNRAETLAEASALRAELMGAFPKSQGYSVGKVLKDAEYNPGRDAVGKGFMADLFEMLDAQGADAALRDSVAQLYLSSLPDLSWAKHGIHRKGTPGFSQDARRAFAQNMFHGAYHLAKLRYGDQLQDALSDLEDQVAAERDNEGFDSVKAVQVLDEMNKRHENLMNPQGHPVSTALTSLGFVWHLANPASAVVNLSGVPLMAYPMMGAKWGMGKAGKALLAAAGQIGKARNDLSRVLEGDELQAFERATRDGTIDVTQSHDLAGIAQGEDAGTVLKTREVMRLASFMFHHAERFNRQAVFLSAYRLAREGGADVDAAFEQAKQMVYESQFDYAASNRPRFMQGNWQKVLFLFKQYGQNMVYTLSRQAYLAAKGETPAQRAQARKALSGILAMHAVAAGALGLPLVGPLLAAASWIGGDDDEPWDAEVALRNYLAETFGQKPAEVMARGLSRLTPWDLSGRVGLDRLILPDVQEGLEGASLGNAMLASAAGPVAGIAVNLAKGISEMSDGDYQRGLESMTPSLVRSAIKSYRYATEGVIDKTGVVILDEVNATGIAGQALGLSPSAVRLASEGKQAIYRDDKARMERRQTLMTQYAQARMVSDMDGMRDIAKDISRFNEKNPARRITTQQLLQSVRNRQKRINEAERGIYLPAKRRDAMSAGAFADESDEE